MSQIPRYFKIVFALSIVCFHLSCRRDVEAMVDFRVEVTDNKNSPVSTAEVLLDGKKVGLTDGDGKLTKSLFLKKESHVLVEVKKESQKLYYSPFMIKEYISENQSQMLKINAKMYFVPKNGEEEEPSAKVTVLNTTKPVEKVETKPLEALSQQPLVAKAVTTVSVPPTILPSSVKKTDLSKQKIAVEDSNKKEQTEKTNKALIKPIKNKMKMVSNAGKKKVLTPHKADEFKVKLNVISYIPAKNRRFPLSHVKVLVNGKKIGETDKKGVFQEDIYQPKDSLITVTLVDKTHMPETFSTDFIMSYDMLIEKGFTSRHARKPSFEGAVLSKQKEGKVIVNLGSLQGINIKENDLLTVYGMQINENGNEKKEVVSGELIVKKVNLATSECEIKFLKPRSFISTGGRVVLLGHESPLAKISKKEKKHT
jgi:hypothetical protein